MLIDASAILNSTITVGEPNLHCGYSARAEPSSATRNLALLPLSTLLEPGPRQAPTAPSPSSGASTLDSGILGSFEFSTSTMLPSGAGDGYIQDPTLPATSNFPSTSPTPSSSSSPGSSTDTGTTMVSTTQMFSSPTSTFIISPIGSWSPTSACTSSTPASTSPTISTSSRNTNTVEPQPTTFFVLTTALTTFTPSPPSHSQSPSKSTYTITSVLPGHGGTATYLVTTSGSLSTDNVGSAVGGNISQSPGTIAAIVLGIIGAFAFSALWLFCARRRHRKLVRETAPVAPEYYGPGPLEGEVLDGDELGYGVGSVYHTISAASGGGPIVEERYADIFTALRAGEGFAAGNERGSMGGVYPSQRDGATDVDDDMEEDLARASSPTLPLYVLPSDDQPYAFPLSPPPLASTIPHHQATRPAPPPSAYHSTSRRRSSPGPDASAWFGGHSIAPSCNSHYARSQTMGSGSGSGSVDALTRTRTGSEEPLLGIGKPSEMSLGTPAGGGVGGSGGGSGSNTTIAGGSNKLGLGSAFGSPEGSMYTPSAIYPVLQGDTSGSCDARSASGSGSYGYTRSGTPSSFDVLRSVSSQGALSSAYTHGQGQNQGFRFGFGARGSASSGSTGEKRGRYRHSFGNPPTSFRAWKERASGGSEKEKDTTGQGEKDRRRSIGSNTSTSASASGSGNEKQGRASPVMGVRAFLGRLRRGGLTPSPRSSIRDISSLSPPRTSADVDPEKAAGIKGGNRTTPPPIQIHVVTPQRPQYSFVLSNPDPHSSSPDSGKGNATHSSNTPPHHVGLYNPYDAPIYNPHDATYISPNAGGLHPQMALPPGYVFGASAPSPVPTEESRHAEGLLHPRLRVQGCSDASLRDFEDYSRPIGGVVNNRMYSTTTFGTLDDTETCQGTPVQDTHESADIFGATMGVPNESWFVDDGIQNGSRNSPVAP